jgi:hypothetical protein
MIATIDLLSDFLDVNRRLWNAKVDYHVASPMYDVPGFLCGKDTLNSIRMNLLGNIKGKRIIHFQCHFGLDTLACSTRCTTSYRITSSTVTSIQRTL